jgi:hypothetical protein
MTGASVSGISSNSSTKMAPLASEGFHHVPVVDDLMAHIDWRAVLSKRELDDLDGAIDARRRSRAAPRDRWSAGGGQLAA